MAAPGEERRKIIDTVRDKKTPGLPAMDAIFDDCTNPRSCSPGHGPYRKVTPGDLDTILRNVCVTSAPGDGGGRHRRPPIEIPLHPGIGITLLDFRAAFETTMDAHHDDDCFFIQGPETSRLYVWVVAALMTLHASQNRCVQVTIRDTDYRVITMWSKGYVWRALALAEAPPGLSAMGVLGLSGSMASIGSTIKLPSTSERGAEVDWERLWWEAVSASSSSPPAMPLPTPPPVVSVPAPSPSAPEERTPGEVGAATPASVPARGAEAEQQDSHWDTLFARYYNP
jgi:hypothetical protein